MLLKSLPISEGSCGVYCNIHSHFLPGKLRWVSKGNNRYLLTVYDESFFVCFYGSVEFAINTVILEKMCQVLNVTRCVDGYNVKLLNLVLCPYPEYIPTYSSKSA